MVNADGSWQQQTWPQQQQQQQWGGHFAQNMTQAVSYTHLTLPTIYSV